MKKTFFILFVLLINLIGFSQKVINTPDSSLKNISKSNTKIDLNQKSKTVVHCEIKGKVIGGNSKYLMLVTEQDNAFHNGIRIPIVDGQFEYNIVSPFSEKYTLILGEELENGAFIPIPFFAENGLVEFNLHPAQEFDKNKIVGGKLTDKMAVFTKEQKKLFDPIEKPFNEEIDSLWDSNNYFSKESNDLLVKIKELKADVELKASVEINELYKKNDELLETEKGYTPRAWFLNMKRDSIEKLKFDWESKYIKSNQDIFSYSLLLNEVKEYKQNKKNIDLNVVTNLFAIYSKKFPSHPYTKQIQILLEAINMIKVGGLFIDFSAPTIEGKMIRASDMITGKVALIDLWASWCGICRVTSKSYISIYEKYKSKGFVVLGVANEFKNTNAFKKAIEKDNYPWLNLIELDNKNRIWDKYNVSNSGGSSFLVDSKGVILAVHPDAKQLEEILGELLK